jgi:hypothetical protein
MGHPLGILQASDRVPRGRTARASQGEAMDKFDEYKFFGERAQLLSERRQAATQTYLTVNTVIFAVLGLLIKDVGFRGWGLVMVSLPLFSVGALACVVWYIIIVQYRQLIGWHYGQLREIEQTFSESQQIFQKEWEKFFSPQQGKERFGFSRLEVWLPRMSLGLYAVYSVGLVVATIFGWT